MPKKKTTSEFIDEAIDVHGNVYDYSLVEYHGSGYPIEIVCKIHGTFKQTPKSHLRGCGCRECGFEKTATSKRTSKEDFIKKAKEVHEDKYDYSLVEYLNNWNHIRIVCPIHGEFTQKPSHHLDGSGCKECSSTKRSETMSRLYGVSNPAQLHFTDEIIHKLNNYDYMNEWYNKVGGHELASMVGIDKYTVYSYLRKHNIEIDKGNSSFAEKQINDHIQSLGLTTVENDRSVLDGKEIDILVPELNLGIEFDGLYWHSTKYMSDKNYHLNKTQLAESKGIRLIHIFEDEWIEKRDVVLDKISNLCGIRKNVAYARKTECHEITNRIARAFYDTNHIQGYSQATKVYGLYHNLTLVACMSFKRSSTMQEGEWDLSRFATSCNVVGGFSKLLKRFIRDTAPSSIISFADKRWSKGDLYFKNGFTHEYDTDPNYYYIEGERRVRKEHYRRKHLPEKLGHMFDSDLSEIANTENAGVYRIYDCGLMKFRLTL